MNRFKKGKIDVTPVSLVELKAEISRKKVQLASKPKEQVSEGIIPDNFKSIPIKKCMRRNSGASSSKDENSASTEEINKRDIQLEKSRIALEAKAKLYDALKESAKTGKLKLESCEEEKSDCLIDFEKKVMEEDSYSKSDQTYPPNHAERYGRRPYDISDSSCSDDDEFDDRVTYNQMVKNCKDSIDNVTYSHLRQGEVRQHGVGFYTFSTDADERAAEMNKLNEMHQEAEKAKKLAAENKLKQDVELGKRLAKLRARKGLPDVSVMAANALDNSNFNDSARERAEEIDISSMLRQMRDEAEDRAREKEAKELKYLKETGQIDTGESFKNQTLSDFSGRAKPGSKRAWDQDKPVIMNAPRR